MTEAAHDQATMFAAWLATGDPDMGRIAIAMGGVSENEWETIAASLPSPFDADAVGSVIARAHELLSRAPSDAKSLTRLALRMTRQMNGATCSDLPLIEGDAWRECAAAHLKMAEFSDALEAVSRARACYARSESSRVNAAILLLLEARTLFELGRGNEALAAVDLGARELLDSGADRKKYVQAKTIQASILMGMGQHDAAMDVFNATARLALQAGDKETLAYIVWNTGLIAAKLGDTDNAKRSFDAALRYFDALGLRGEIPHVRAALAALLKQQGRYDEAVSELFQVRAEFLSQGIPVAAAIAALRVVEVRLLSGRTTDVAWLCDEMVRTFTAARLQKNLLTALAYLSEAARQRDLAESDVTYVSEFIERAQDDPNQTFAAPA